MCITTKEVIGMPNMDAHERLLLVPKLMEATVGKVAEDKVTQEIADALTDLKQLMA